MSYIPYKINLTNGANSSLIETNSSDLLTITENNIKLAGLVNINDLYKLPNASPSSDGNYFLSSNANVLSFSQYSPVSISQFQYNFYVSTSGDDANPGTQASPYKTIGACMTYINTLGADVNVSINLSSGTYNEAVLINKSGVSIIGSSSTGCIINSDIGINTVQNSSFYSIVEINNVQINGQVSQLNATLYTNSLVLSNVVIAPPAGKNAISIDSTGGGFLADCTIKNSSVIYANNDTIAILLTNGAINMIGSQVTNNPTLANTIESFIKANGSSRVNLFGSSLIQNSTSASVKALIEISNTANATSSSTINNCILQFTASTSTASGSVVNFSNSASANTYFFYNNAIKTNFNIGTGSDKYIIYKTSTGAVNFTFGNVLSYNNTNHSIPNTGFVTGYVKTLMKTVL
jgi:hypothetical protein